jgi:hypothetical protein
MGIISRALCSLLIHLWRALEKWSLWKDVLFISLFIHRQMEQQHLLNRDALGATRRLYLHRN